MGQTFQVDFLLVTNCYLYWKLNYLYWDLKGGIHGTIGKCNLLGESFPALPGGSTKKVPEQKEEDESHLLHGHTPALERRPGWVASGDHIRGTPTLTQTTLGGPQPP